MKCFALAPFLFCLTLHAQHRRIEFATYALWGASSATDVALSQVCIQNHTCQEANPAMQHAMIPVEIGVTALSMWAFHHFRGNKERWAIPAIQIGLHGVGIWSAERYAP